MFPRLRLVLCLLPLFLSVGLAQSSVRLAFWNVENLFDTTDAPLIRDDGFTPQGKYQWTSQRLEAKFRALTRVVNDLNAQHDLGLLGLAEIENRTVLQQWNDDYLKQGFKIIHQESPDERGIDCALLYSPRLLKLKEAHFLPVFLSGDEKTRDIIEAVFEFATRKPGPVLHVFVNHWPSRWGGQAQTDPYRRVAAQTLRTRIDEILTGDPVADIVVLGDFNDYPDDPSLLQVLRAEPPSAKRYPGDLINTCWQLNENPDAGTVMYRGDWKVFDQIIISEGLLDMKAYSWQLNSTTAFHPDYLIEQQGKYAGWPFRTYRRGHYQAGYSDHLPVSCLIRYHKR